MKAKKIIAIGLVATMTLGMSTSVFATTVYPDYSGEPEFENWDKEFHPDDNAYHVKGQGWLESGTGINESAVNVLVPTTPNVNIKRGEPGLFDFGFDPQRLVKRTDAEKYKDKEYFTKDAAEAGIYFINNTRDYSLDQIYKPSGDNINYSLNTFDNKSVKYEAINIGTEDVALTVKATLAGGNSLEYLEEDPTMEIKAGNYFAGIYEVLGPTWGNYVTTHPDTENPYRSSGVVNMYQFAYDLVHSEDQGFLYSFADVFNNDDQKNILNQAIISKLVPVNGGEEVSTVSVLSEAVRATANADALYAYLNGYVLVGGVEPEPSENVGIYMGLNVATGVENGEYAARKEVPFKTANDGSQNNDTEPKTIDAAAEFTQVVKGNPDNYETIWDPGTKTYRYAMKPSEGDNKRTEPFETVAFWFRGVATEDATIPEDLAVPALDFTWSFSKEIPGPEVNLKKVNGQAVTEVPTIFTEKNCINGTIDLLFDTEIEKVQINKFGEGKEWFAMPDAYCTVNGAEVVINLVDFETAINNGHRYLKFVGKNGGVWYVEVKHEENV